jgi:hypothetical protein
MAALFFYNAAIWYSKTCRIKQLSDDEQSNV